MKADAIRKPSASQVRELSNNEIDAVAGGKWVKMLTKWYWATGDGHPKVGGGPGTPISQRNWKSGRDGRSFLRVMQAAPPGTHCETLQRERALTVHALAGPSRFGPPPMKWSDSKYGFATEEDCNGEEAQTGRDRCEVAAG